MSDNSDNKVPIVWLLISTFSSRKDFRFFGGFEVKGACVKLAMFSMSRIVKAQKGLSIFFSEDFFTEYWHVHPVSFHFVVGPSLIEMVPALASFIVSFTPTLNK